MREIKFRAWHTKKKIMFPAEEMAQDQMTLLTTGYFINVNSRDVRLSSIDYGHIMIPLQYTGLKDKNGKEIYEGDILQLYSVNEWDKPLYDKGDVIWSDAGFWVNFGDRKIELYIDSAMYKIIGNIYENPELLNVAKYA